MAVIAITPVPKTGLVNPAYTAVAAADRVPPGTIVHVKNGNASACVVTLTTLDNADGDLVVTDRTITSIPATTGVGFIVVPRVWPYVDPVDGLVGMVCSVTASVTVLVLSAP
jgi:hypothetical protein